MIPLNGYVMKASRNRHIYLHFFIFTKIRPCLHFKREQIWLEEEKIFCGCQKWKMREENTQAQMVSLSFIQNRIYEDFE